MAQIFSYAFSSKLWPYLLDTGALLSFKAKKNGLKDVFTATPVLQSREKSGWQKTMVKPGWYFDPEVRRFMQEARQSLGSTAKYSLELPPTAVSIEPRCAGLC